MTPMGPPSIPVNKDLGRGRPCPSALKAGTGSKDRASFSCSSRAEHYKRRKGAYAEVRPRSCGAYKVLRVTKKGRGLWEHTAAYLTQSELSGEAF